MNNQKRPLIAPVTNSQFSLKKCWVCNGRATVAVRRLSLRFPRYFCHSCSRTLKMASLAEGRSGA